MTNAGDGSAAGDSALTEEHTATGASNGHVLACLHVGKFYPPDPGGMESYLRDLLEALSARGVRSAALVHGSDNDPATVPEKPLIRRARVWFSVAFTPIAPTFPFLLHRMITAQQPAMLHLHLPNVSAFWALLLPSARRLPWVIHWHADVPLSDHQWRLRLLYRFYRPFEQWLLRRANRIVATSQPYLETSEPLRPWRSKCEVVPLGIKAPTAPPVSTAIDRGEGELRVLAVGRLSYYKGFDVLVRAVAGTPGITLDIAGSGEEWSSLAKLVQSLEVTDRVTLHGRVTDARRAALLAASDCLCLPSIERTEAFGVVLLESMAAGKACLATAVPGTGMGWVVQDRATGLIVPPGDPEALAAALRYLRDNPDARANYGARGHERFRANFLIDRSAGHILALYRQCLTEVR